MPDHASLPTLGPWLNAKEAAAYVGVSWDTLKPWLLDHDVPHLRMGRRWKIKRETLDEYLDRAAREQVGAA